MTEKAATTITNHQNEESIQHIQLKGHTSSVLCLDHSSSVEGLSSRPLLLSGSEDKTARLWDLRISSRASLCILNNNEVTSVSFLKPPRWNFTEHSASEKMVPGHPYMLYIAAGTGTYAYDIRNPSSPILRQPNHDLTSILGTCDEINQLHLFVPTTTTKSSSTTNSTNKKGKKGRKKSSSSSGNGGRIWMALADDSGQIRITDDIFNNHHHDHDHKTKIFNHAEDGIAMAMCAEFRPRSSVEFASGGTDCAVRLWDIGCCSKPCCTYQILPEDGASNTQICNPPLVHSLSWSISGRLLASGLGDGTISILRRTDNRTGPSTLDQVTRLCGGHDSSVASVLFPKSCFIHDSSSSASTAKDRLLISAGTDGAILFWDLGTNVASECALDPASYFASSIIVKSLEEKNNESSSSLSKIMFGIPHKAKLNWMVTGSVNDIVFPSTLFVVDTTCDISAYILPRG